MEKTILSIPGYCVYEYLLVLIPHEELSHQIILLKNDFSKKYRTAQTFQSNPHILLVRFSALHMTEKRIVNRLGTIATGIKQFKVELNGFGAFPSHTIYTKVTTKVPVQELIKKLKSASQLMTLNKEHKPHFIEEPHLAICSKLKPWQFNQGWLVYANHHFTGRFIADHMMLLRRPAGEKAYQPLMSFEFQNLAVDTKQGNLFM